MTIIDNPAVGFFAARLAFQTDVSDVHQAIESGDAGFVLIDSRGPAAWSQGHIAAARHLPTAEIARRATRELDATVPLVTYCWGPGCNGATQAALALAELGFAVKEMIGGIEYWIREGFPIHAASGRLVRAADPLTAPVSSVSCEC